VPLYAPKAAAPPALDGLISLNFGNWLQGTNLTPTLFATDNQGNIYFTVYANQKWADWRSFYN
jgi:hypothetical protein